MRTGAAESTIVRKNLTLQARTTARLDSLRAKLEASSDSEIVRQALRYFEEYLEDDAKGKGFFITPNSGEPYQITLASLGEDGDDKFIRRNILIHQSSVDRLEVMKSRAHVGSDSEMIRMALKFYGDLVEQAEAGSQFWVGDENEKLQVRIAGLSSPARPAAGDNPISKASQSHTPHLKAS